MKWIRDAHGQPRRPWYDDDEIESIVSSKIKDAATFIVPDLVLDLERFAEQHCNVALDQYAQLPPEILGATEFSSDGTVRVFMNRELTIAMEEGASDVSKIGRWRATLAHELGHVILHRILFTDHPEQLGLLDHALEEVQGALRCLTQTIGTASLSVGWKEVQANKGMAAMLMPRGPFTRYVDDLLTEGRNFRSARNTIEAIAQAFRVSRQAVTIRIAELGLIGPSQRLI